MNFSFNPSCYNPKTKTILLHGNTVRDPLVTVTSEVTGVSKHFKYDAAATSLEYQENEGWDGEQHVSIFTNGDITLRVWCTPYDEW